MTAERLKELSMSLVRLCCLALFWLASGAAVAANYVFPTAMPSGCSGLSGSYSCSALTLAWGDTIAISGTKPATITVTGAFDARNAQINTAGNVNDLSLVVTGNFACDQCMVNANLTVGGQTNLTYLGIIRGTLSASGAVTLGTSSEIGGTLAAAGQSVTAQSGVKVHGDATVGSLSSTGSSSYFGGSIVATNGSVSLPHASLVVGSVTVQDKDETVTLASAQAKVGGCVTVNSNKSSAITLGWQASVGGVCCSPGNSGCKDSCVKNDSGGAMPAICTATTTPTVDGFNAIDSAYASTSTNFLAGHIYTKLAGVGFTLQVAALYNNLIQTDYASTGDKTVSVKLVDNSDGLCGTDATRQTACSACNGRAAVSGGSQSLTFAASNSGVRSTGTFTLAAAYSNLVAVISDGSVTACSVDSFAVRPTRISSVASSASNSTLTGTPKLKAGSDSFTIDATVAAGSYNGILKINSAAMRATGNDWTVGALDPLVFPAATGGGATSTASTSFTYAEVGNFRFLGFDPASDASSPRSIYDDSWTVIDSAKSDCVVGSYANVQDSGGKYGCLFGLHDGGAAQPDSLLFGRFVPDHFAYLGGSLKPFCSTASAFTYMGQPALGIAYRLQAVNGAGAVTANYSQVLTPPYPVATPSLAAEDQAAAYQGCDLASRIGSLPSAQWVAGVYALNDANADNLPDTATASFSRPTVPLDLTAATCAANRASAGGPFWLLDIGVAINDADVTA
ncbi:MAG TPA: hypothetical protein VF096_06585, partial [Azonexus sp.]